MIKLILFDTFVRDLVDEDGNQGDNGNRGDDMFKINPYRPGAGLMPTYLAGRDEDIQNVDNLFEALILNIPTQSVIFSGLRGVGKTVLMNQLQKIAEDKRIFCKHIEVEERNDFISQLASCS